MKRVRYTKYNGDLGSEMDLDDLLKSLSDYLLDSGFQDPFSKFAELQGDQTLDNLREALRQALEAGDLDQDTQQRLDEMSAEQMEQLIEQLIQRMEQENYISIDQPHDPSRPSSLPGNVGEAQNETRFEVTDKSMDFLGYRTLRDLLGSLGKSSFGRHDTLNLATGIEASGASKPYEFGDTLNLDSVATLSSAIAREGLATPLNIEYSRPPGQPVRVSEFMRDRRHARLLALHDPLRRRPLYTREESRHGAFAPHPYAVSGRLTVARALPRLCGRNSGVADCARQGWPLTTPTPAKACALPSASSIASART